MDRIPPWRAQSAMKKDPTASTPLTSLDPRLWEPHAVFRESFLGLRLPEELADLGRHLGWHLYRETLQRLPGTWSVIEDPLQRALMAHARDLRFHQGALLVLGNSGDLSSRERTRTQMAQHVAESLDRLSLTLETASR